MRKHAIILDGSTLHLMHLSAALKEIQWDCTEVNDMDQAMAILGTRYVDLAFIDEQALLEAEGEFAIWLCEKSPTLPLILYGADRQKAMDRVRKGLNVVGTLSKPINPQQLSILMDRYYEQH